MRLLADTNVLLDYLLRRPGHSEEIRDLFVMDFCGDAEIWASAKSLTDIFSVARRAIGSEATQRNMLAMLERLQAVAIDGDDVRASAEACWPDFEGCLIARAADKVKADYIVTRNKAGFAAATVPAASPREVLDAVAEKTGHHYAELMW